MARFPDFTSRSCRAPPTTTIKGSCSSNEMPCLFHAFLASCEANWWWKPGSRVVSDLIWGYFIVEALETPFCSKQSSEANSVVVVTAKQSRFHRLTSHKNKPTNGECPFKSFTSSIKRYKLLPLSLLLFFAISPQRFSSARSQSFVEAESPNCEGLLWQ